MDDNVSKKHTASILRVTLITTLKMEAHFTTETSLSTYKPTTCTRTAIVTSLYYVHLLPTQTTEPKHIENSPHSINL
jgi:hypothetical protein